MPIYLYDIVMFLSFGTLKNSLDHDQTAPRKTLFAI